MKPITFGVIADLHADIAPDAAARLDTFLTVCQQKNANFIVQLGDFIDPQPHTRCVCRPENRPVNIQAALDCPSPIHRAKLLALFRSFSGAHYHVLGNHDLDFCTKQQVLQFLGMPSAQYAFSCEGFRFAVLDCNFYREQGIDRDFECGNYFDSTQLPYYPPTQLAWLRTELWAHIGTPYVLFSHQRLLAEPFGLKNHAQLRALFQEYAAVGGRIVLSMNGHNHMDGVTLQDGICFFDVNSAANQWLGEAFSCKRFSPAVDDAFPSLRYTAPYQDVLFALVEIDAQQIHIQGRHSSFVPPSPKALGCEEPYTAVVSDYTFSY